MHTKSDVAQLNQRASEFCDSDIPITKHMLATWHRFEMQQHYHLNSDKNRLEFIVWYILDFLPGRNFGVDLDTPELVASLSRSISCFGPMNVFAHEVWRTRYAHRPELNIHAEDGYFGFAVELFYRLAPEKRIPRKLLPSGMQNRLNEAAHSDGRHYLSRGLKTVHADAEVYLTKYQDLQHWPTLEAYNFDSIIHLYGRTGDIGTLPGPTISYWASPALQSHRHISKFIWALAMLAPRFKGRFVSEFSLFEHADEVASWFSDEVLTDHPNFRIFAPALPRAGLATDNLKSRRREKSYSKYRINYLPGQKSEEIDLLIVGPFGAASGLGTGTRRSVDALASIGCNFRVVNCMYDNPSRNVEAIAPQLLFKGERPKATLWHFNGEYLPEVLATLPDLVNPSLNIGYFFWETSALPHAHRLACEMVDEIWAPSAFVADTYSGAKVPSVNVGTAVSHPAVDGSFGRADFGLDADEYCFLFSFDAHSVIHRKNPAATIKAFRKAFPRGDERARLIIKTQNLGSAHWGKVKGRNEELFELASSDPRISLIDRTMSLGELYALKSLCDCYISLHRSEGFGYGPAEAMALGKPVIMTNYSANVEFASKDHCLLVDGPLLRVERDEYLYWTPEMVWADPDVDHAARHMRALFDEPVMGHALGSRAKVFIEEHFGIAALGRRYAGRLRELGIIQ